MVRKRVSSTVTPVSPRMEMRKRSVKLVMCHVQLAMIMGKSVTRTNVLNARQLIPSASRSPTPVWRSAMNPYLYPRKTCAVSARHHALAALIIKASALVAILKVKLMKHNI